MTKYTFASLTALGLIGCVLVFCALTSASQFRYVAKGLEIPHELTQRVHMAETLLRFPVLWIPAIVASCWATAFVFGPAEDVIEIQSREP